MKIAIIGAGLAGCELAYQLAVLGEEVTLFEGKKSNPNPAQKSKNIAELVCSNSLKSMSPTSASGQLKWEMEAMNSIIMKAARAAAIPGGQSLVVDRDKFSLFIEEKILSSDKIELIEKDVTTLNELIGFEKVVVATGPLTSEGFNAELQRLVGRDSLYFFDAISPIIDRSTVDMEIIFEANRYDKGKEVAYLNCPFEKHEYMTFIEELARAEKVAFGEFEQNTPYFQACQPIEAILESGPKSLLFGPMKPVGLIDPRTGRRPYAVVQLRSESADRAFYNMVGFQTKLKYHEQKKVFQLIPGLKNVKFERYGSVHRNTFINTPEVLDDNLSIDKKYYFAGQILGVEGYLESAATGLVCCESIRGGNGTGFPSGTALGSLYRHLRTKTKRFQPMNMNFGIFPALPNEIKDRKERYKRITERAQNEFLRWKS